MPHPGCEPEPTVFYREGSPAHMVTASSTTEFTYKLANICTFRDRESCERVRLIRREDITTHPNPDFSVGVIDHHDAFYQAFANDLINRIVAARETDEQLVAILPVGPVPQYAIAARTINERRISLAHVHTFNMDEYADEDGKDRTRVLGRIVPACHVGQLPRPHRLRVASPGPPDPFPHQRRNRELQRRQPTMWRCLTSAMAASAGAVTSRSGNRISDLNSPAT